MKLPFPSAVLTAALYLSGSLFAQSAPKASLLVLSKQDLTLAIVDATTLKVVAKAPVGNDPHEVTASADGTTAYVSNYGSGSYNTLAVIDLVSGRALPSIDLGALRGPHGLTFVGGKVWFTAEGAKAIGRYDPATHKVDWVMGTGQNRTHMIHVSDDQKTIVTTNISSGTVSIIDMEPTRNGPGGGLPRGPGGPNRPGGPPPGGQGGPPPGGQGGPPPNGPRPGGQGQGGPNPGGAPPMPAIDWNQTVVRVGNGSEGFDVSPDGKEVWAANANDATISVIDLAQKKVVDTLAANVPSANRLRFTPDGKLVLVSSGANLVVLDAATRQVVKRILVGHNGHGAGGLLVEPSGARAFVSCGPDNYVAVVDLKTLEVTGTIQAGGSPDGLAWAVRR
jgi:YVTN family beta-propeller protein